MAEHDHAGSFPVRVVWKEGRGRCVVATRDIMENEVVLQSVAYGVGVDEEWKLKVCEMMNLLSLFNSQYVPDQKSDIKVLIHMLCKSLQENSSDVASHQEDDRELYNASYNPSISQVLELEGHEEAYCDSLKRGIWRIANDVEEIFNQTSQIGTIDVPDCGNQVMKKENAFKLLCKFKCNNYGLWNEKDECTASFLFVSASYVNHSCDPNAQRYQNKNSCNTTIRALREIKQNEEITISYIDNSAPFHVRNEILSTGYFFTCDCIKCKNQE